MKLLAHISGAMENPANELVGKIIDKAGVGSVVVGAGGAAVDSATQSALSLPDWAAIVAIIGGLVYIVKLVLEIMVLREQG